MPLSPPFIHVLTWPHLFAAARSFARSWHFFAQALAVSTLWTLAAPRTQASGVLNLEFSGTPTLPLASNQTFPGASNGSCTLKRLDFLLSGLALQREDGTWAESNDWTAFISIGKKQLTAQSTGVAPGKYRAVRFRIGVDPQTDLSSPSIYPPNHPLHPDVCGLHWSWQGGYIYMALEGLSSSSFHGSNAFSLHLARAGNSPIITLPAVFDGGGPITLKIALDLSELLTDIDFSKDGNSTHSRPGDPIPARLMRNLSRAFTVQSVASDTFQALPAAAESPTPPPSGTHPYPLEISDRLPKVSLPADNPLTEEGVSLGSRLFHDARLSINQSQSCASCHVQEHGLTDPRRFSIGAEGHVGTRRSMPLANLAWQKRFFWDGRAPSLREQVLMPVRDPHEMNESPENVARKLLQDPLYPAAFHLAFGSPGITPQRIAFALEQFLLTRVSQNSRFDLALRKLGDLSETEKRGLQLFVTEHAPERGLRGADCFHCHGGMLFSDHEFHDNGLPLDPSDSGLYGVTKDPADRGKFKTPSLRNVAARAPYMHDGRFATLEEVVEHYNSGVQRRPNLDPNLAKHPSTGLGLTSQEKRELVAFLKTLSDPSFLTSSAPSPHPAP